MKTLQGTTPVHEAVRWSVAMGCRMGALCALLGLTLWTTGCDRTEPGPGPAPNTQPTEDDDHGHSHGNPGEAIELGTATVGMYTVHATRDAGTVEPAGDVPADFYLTPADAKVTAVRFWVGREDAAGSVKSKADRMEQAGHWHQHTEVPSPLPKGSRLWVELEIEGVGKQQGSFELR